MEENKEQLKFPGFPENPEENYWKYPRVCNGWWHKLTGNEQKVLDYILRHTWGYQKTSDKISISQFIKGIFNKTTGQWVDRGTGIKNRNIIIKALRKLEELGFVQITRREGKTTEIALIKKREKKSEYFIPGIGEIKNQ